MGDWNLDWDFGHLNFVIGLSWKLEIWGVRSVGLIASWNLNLTFEFGGLWNLKLGSNFEVILNFIGGCWTLKFWGWELKFQVLKFEVIFGFEWSNLDFKMGLKLEIWGVLVWFDGELKFEIWILDSNGIVDLICEFRIFIWSIWILNGEFELCLRFRSYEGWSNIWIWMVEFEVWKLFNGFELKFEIWGVLVSWWFEIWVWNRMGWWIWLVNFGFSFEKRFVFWRDIWILNGGFWIWSLMREVCSL